MTTIRRLGVRGNAASATSRTRNSSGSSQGSPTKRSSGFGRRTADEDDAAARLPPAHTRSRRVRRDGPHLAAGTSLDAHSVLTAPAAAEKPETAIVDAALHGKLDQKALDRRLPTAARAHAENLYRLELARTSEHTLVGQFHRTLEAGAANAIILSLREPYDLHAEQIAHAKSLFTSESSPEHVLASAEAGTIEAWQQLGDHIQA